MQAGNIEVTRPMEATPSQVRCTQESHQSQKKGDAISRYYPLEPDPTPSSFLRNTERVADRENQLLRCP